MDTTSYGVPVTQNQETRPLAVLGAGVMGVGITALLLGHRRRVVLVDTDESKLDQARAEVSRHLRLGRLMGALPREGTDGELVTSTGPDAMAGAAAVIEAVTEETAAKAKALSDAAAATAPGTPLVSNTSSIPIDELARGMSRPEDLVGVHFMNPPYLIATVEAVQGPRTSPAAMAAVRGLLAGLGRRAVVVGDGPGFVTSRILHRMINDAARIVAEGRASAEDVDTLLQDCLGHRTGPLRTADLIGLDNLVDSLRVLHERTGDDGCRPCDLLLDKVRDGDLGRKSGRGFYDYLEARP
jgi:methoxymalonate biosynthesis protein